MQENNVSAAEITDLSSPGRFLKHFLSRIVKMLDKSE